MRAIDDECQYDSGYFEGFEGGYEIGYRDCMIVENAILLLFSGCDWVTAADILDCDSTGVKERYPHITENDVQNLMNALSTEGLPRLWERRGVDDAWEYRKIA